MPLSILLSPSIQGHLSCVKETCSRLGSSLSSLPLSLAPQTLFPHNFKYFCLHLVSKAWDILANHGAAAPVTNTKNSSSAAHSSAHGGIPTGPEPTLKPQSDVEASRIISSENRLFFLSSSIEPALCRGSSTPFCLPACHSYLGLLRLFQLRMFTLE